MCLSKHSVLTPGLHWLGFLRETPPPKQDIKKGGVFYFIILSVGVPDCRYCRKSEKGAESLRTKSMGSCKPT